jgi:hypothetical protein
VNRIGKNRVVFAGLWTSVCIVGPALSAIDQGFEVYVIADACGDVSEEAHNRAIDRMVQAGVRPTWALTLGGAGGVNGLVEYFRRELVDAMLHCGVNDIASLGPVHVRPVAR